MTVTPYDIASRFVGVKELPGEQDNPFIMAFLKLDASWPENEGVPWCSAFVNFVSWLLRLPRSKSLSARSNLSVGTPVGIHEARVGFDIVILKRGEGNQPGPERLDAPGHVGFFAGWQDPTTVLVLGGNQGNAVSIQPFLSDRILGIRRLA